MKYTHLFLDLDNTLFDFTGSSRLAFSAMLEHFKIQEEGDFYDLYKRINHDVWDELERGKIDQVQLREKRFRLFFSAIKESIDGLEANTVYLQKLVDKSMLLPGARKLLDELKSEFILFAITNGLREVQRPRMEKTNTIHYFDHVVVSDEIGYTKPDRAFFDVAFAPIQGEVGKQQVLVIGDSLSSDIRGGNNYGLDTCHFNPQRFPYVRDVRPTYNVPDYQGLRKVLGLDKDKMIND